MHRKYTGVHKKTVIQWCMTKPVAKNPFVGESIVRSVVSPSKFKEILTANIIIPQAVMIRICFAI